MDMFILYFDGDLEYDSINGNDIKYEYGYIKFRFIDEN